MLVTSWEWGKYGSGKVRSGKRRTNSWGWKMHDQKSRDKIARVKKRGIKFRTFWVEKAEPPAVYGTRNG